jgi:hypothetical protein
MACPNIVSIHPYHTSHRINTPALFGTLYTCAIVLYSTLSDLSWNGRPPTGTHHGDTTVTHLWKHTHELLPCEVHTRPRSSTWRRKGEKLCLQQGWQTQDQPPIGTLKGPRYYSIATHSEPLLRSRKAIRPHFPFDSLAPADTYIFPMLPVRMVVSAERLQMDHGSVWAVKSNRVPLRKWRQLGKERKVLSGTI